MLRLIARGYAYKEVAKELFISVKTVETHVSAVLRKLQLSNRHELTRWAADRRLDLATCQGEDDVYVVLTLTRPQLVVEGTDSRVTVVVSVLPPRT